MSCPYCVIELRISNRPGVAVDACPHCHGAALGQADASQLSSAEGEDWGADGGETETRAEGSRDAAGRRPANERRAGQFRDAFWSRMFGSD